jgi:pSer/pThr/pTyr-binding forkhead associated (FHA) protein
MDSKHGTLVNGQSIDSPTELKHGDQIEVGSVALRYREFFTAATDPGSSPGIDEPIYR